MKRVLFLLAVLAACSPGGRDSGPLAHSAYVWQRSWNPAVRGAVRGSDLRELVALAAEVDLSARPPRIARVALADVGRPLGLAIRIGRFHGWGGGTGRFADEPETVRLLVALIREIARRAPPEIQIDYDCPESQLADYRVLLAAARPAAAPARLTITALPSWLRHERAFASLVAATDGYVLQVHSARPPEGSRPVELVDPEEAVRAVETAAGFGRPFRVALPTYSYGLVRDERGSVVGLSAEGAGGGPAAAVSDPAALAGLIRTWTRDRPPELAGVIWFRLPVPGDVRNWPPETWRAVREGRAPRPELRRALREPEPGLVEIELVNAGETDHAPPPTLGARWNGGRLLAADGLAGYHVTASGPREIHLRLRDPGRPLRPLRPGTRRKAAWLRFDTRPTEIFLD